MRLDQSIRVTDGVRALWTSDPGTQLLAETVTDLARVLKGCSPWALYGALAVGAYSRPHGADEVEILLTGDDDIHSIMVRTRQEFEPTGQHHIRHRSTGIPVRLVTPELIHADPAIIQLAIRSAIRRRLRGVAVPVVSREGLVAVSLCGGADYDHAHIRVVVRHGGAVDLSRYPMTAQQIKVYTNILQEERSRGTHSGTHAVDNPPT